MKKKIRDVTCEEYLRWANDRATDGQKIFLIRLTNAL